MSAAEYLNPPGLAPAQGDYSQAGTGNPNTLVFVAGQLSVGTNGDVVGVGDFAAQFEQIFANLGALLKSLGLDFSSVVKFTTFLTDENDLDAFMKLRAEAFPKMFPTADFPPNTLLIVKRLVKPEFLLEVEAVVTRAPA
ncbi:RidA family protein [Acuticoccus mangrovi]|uniref:RidA family protein n=1 Tax=Acuticoccus mangrovi TaxID=2796142 RepID=A0A934IR81_9HYPH|nr:RidA family protein [Acuticoccus mangrovi]MBJ3778622.1 RidA family protein [Acuticoccus mangrovi]